MRRHTTLAVALALPASLFLLAALSAGVAARPATVEVVLNPDKDTYMGEAVGSPMDGSSVIMTGWMHTARYREYRAYLHFPLDPEQHPASGLVRAELWLYPNRETEAVAPVAAFRARVMTEAFVDGRTAPRWFTAGDPSIERELDTRSVTWKTFPVKDHVLAMLGDPTRNHGFEIAGVDPSDSTKFDFISREGAQPYPNGRQPRLVLTFRDDAFPTPTQPVSATPTPSITPTPVPPTTPPPPTATAQDTATPTATDVPTPTVPPTRPPGTRIYLPHAVRAD